MWRFDRFQTYLQFDNALLMWMSGCVLIMLVLFLFGRFSENGGVRGVLDYLHGGWRERGTAGEIGAAMTSVVLGIFVRASALWWWRDHGGGPLSFPIVPVAIGDIALLTGLLCLMRLLAVDRPTNWPWIAAALSGTVFAMVSVLY